MVWLSMFGGSSVPRTLAILMGLELAQDGKVAHDIAICSACTRVRMAAAELEVTYLPRGVVRPIPLYMAVMTQRGMMMISQRLVHTRHLRQRIFT